MIPIIINRVSDMLQIKHTTKTKLFFNPCCITNKFCGPIAIIKVKPMIKPCIKSKKIMLFYQNILLNNNYEIYIINNYFPIY